MTDVAAVANESPSERLDRAAVALLVRASFARVWRIDITRVTESTPLLDEDAGQDSMAAVEIIEDIERELGNLGIHGIRIEDEDLEDIKNVRDAVYIVCKALGI